MPPNRLLALVAAAATLAAGLPAASAAVPAVTDHVVLNEALVTPADGQGPEAVELYNPAAREVPVDGWRLRGQWNHPNGCLSMDGDPDKLSGTLRPGEIRVVRLPNDHGDLTCLNLEPDDDYLVLEDEAGAEVDEVCWGTGCAGTDGTSAPSGVPAGDTIQRCFVVSGPDEGVADEALGEVGWRAGEPTLGRPNPVCPGNTSA